MAAQDCIDAAEKAAGGKLNLAQITEAIEVLQERQKQLMATDASLSSEDAALRAADELGQEAMQAAAYNKRAAFINARRRAEALSYLRNNWADQPVLGAESFLVGTNLARTGSRASVSVEQSQLAKSYVGGLLSDLEVAGNLDSLSSGVFDDDIARALWKLRDQAPDFTGVPKVAVDIAKTIGKWQDTSRINANKAGAMIGKLDNYITKQSHDPLRIRAAGKEAWIKSILPKLDPSTFKDNPSNAAIKAEMKGIDDQLSEKGALEKMTASFKKSGLSDSEAAVSAKRSLDSAYAHARKRKAELQSMISGDPLEYLSAVYDGLASGVHFKSTGAPAGAFTGPRNIAKQVSQERVLHFRSAEDWTAYNREFGMGNIRESVIGSLSQLGESTALMKRLGTNPESNWNNVLDSFAKDLKGQPEKLKAFDDARKRMLKNRFSEVDGTTRIPVDGDLARYSSAARAWVNMTSLGASIASSVTDIPVAASELRYQGKGMLSGMGEMLKGLTSGRKSVEERQILSMLGVYMEGMRGATTNRFSVDDTLPGQVSKWQNLYFRMNLQSWWTDTHRASSGLSMSNYLAANSVHGFDSLPKELTRALNLYGIDAGRWDLMRSAQLSEANGRQFMTTQDFANISDDALTGYLESQGRTSSKNSIAELREELSSQLRSYISDRVSYAVLEPDARTRSVLRQGTQPGTVSGELMRFFGQFKSFGVSFLQKAAGRELYGRDYVPTEFGRNLAPFRELLQAASTGSPAAQFMGMANLVAWSTVFGYMALAAKDLFKGKEPRDPLDPKVWMASFVQGGGFGIYTDFLFGEASRFGNKPLETLAGPFASRAAGVVDIVQQSRLAATGEDVDLASKLFRLGQSSTPFANLFYIKPVLDYAIFYRIQEWMNPGSMIRMEQRVKKENNQQFLLRPSEVVR